MRVHLLCAAQMKSRLLTLMFVVFDGDEFCLKLLPAGLLRIGLLLWVSSLWLSRVLSAVERLECQNSLAVFSCYPFRRWPTCCNSLKFSQHRGLRPGSAFMTRRGLKGFRRLFRDGVSSFSVAVGRHRQYWGSTSTGGSDNR